MTVTIWEYSDLKRDSRGNASIAASGVLATDEISCITGLPEPVKQIATSATAADAPALTSKTHFIVMYNSGAAPVYYRMRPKSPKLGQTFPANSTCRSIPATGRVVEASYPGCIISFKE